MADCTGKYDEFNCNMVSIDEHFYRQEYPPFMPNGLPISVKINLTVITVGNIKEIDMTFEASIFLHLEW